MNLIAHDIILRPIITEKSSHQMTMNQYSFEVHPSVNKIQIREAVEKIFKVKVLKVNTLNVAPKPKRRGVLKGKTRSWKKAIVFLAEGQRIEFFEGASI
jgi:large subunit ribosomal protein L23